MSVSFLLNDLTDFILVWGGLSWGQLLGITVVTYLIGILIYVSTTTSTIRIASNVLLDENKSVGNVLKEKLLPITMSIISLSMLLMLGAYIISMVVVPLLVAQNMFSWVFIILIYLVIGYILFDYIFFIQSYVLYFGDFREALFYSKKIMKGNKDVALALWLVLHLVLLLKYVLPRSLGAIIGALYGVLSVVISPTIMTALFIRLGGHNQEHEDESISEI